MGTGRLAAGRLKGLVMKGRVFSKEGALHTDLHQGVG